MGVLWFFLLHDNEKYGINNYLKEFKKNLLIFIFFLQL